MPIYKLVAVTASHIIYQPTIVGKIFEENNFIINIIKYYKTGKWNYLL